MKLEYRVVWKWKPYGSLGHPTEQRTKIYKTLKGAERFNNKLHQNNGVFQKWRDNFLGADEVETWNLDYAYIEARDVTEWISLEEYNKVYLACGCTQDEHENSVEAIHREHPEIQMLQALDPAEGSPRWYTLIG